MAKAIHCPCGYTATAATTQAAVAHLTEHLRYRAEQARRGESCDPRCCVQSAPNGVQLEGAAALVPKP